MRTNRWLIFVLAVMVAFYTAGLNVWSIFQKPLIEQLGATPSSAALPYSICIIMMALAGPFSGRIMDKYGPRVAMLIGIVFWSVGWFASGYATSMTQLIITFGILVGIGDGFIYQNAVANTVKWFPDKKGMIAGLFVGICILGPLYFGPLGQYIITNYDVLMAFKIMGIQSLVFMGLLAMFIKAAPEGYKPAGWEPPVLAEGVKPKHADFGDKTPGQVVRDPIYYILLIAYACGVTAGSMMVAHASPIAQFQMGVTPEQAVGIVSSFFLFNGAGRLFWGFLSDRIGRYYTMMAVFVVNAIAIISLTQITSSVTAFVLTLGVIAMCWGGNMAVYPAITNDLWGSKNAGANYGLMFLGFAGGGYIGPRLAGKSVELTGSYNTAYTIDMVLCIVGLLLFIIVAKMVRTRMAEKMAGNSGLRSAK